MLTGHCNPSRCHWDNCTSTCSMTHSPMSTIRSVSSTHGKNSLGGTTPLSGCSQRSNASKPTTVPLRMLTRGWKCRRNS
ncbi:hypothetical protein D3C81_2252150 [compost metagenome]